MDGQLTVKRLRRQDGEVWLVAEDEDHEDLRVTALDEVKVWGVVTYSVHEL